MNKKTKRLLIFIFLLLSSIIILALGLKYFPFTKVLKLPAASEQAFVDPQKMRMLSPHTLYYDFEIAPGKETPDGFYKGIAHSGQYSVKAFGQNSFSVAVERTAKEIGVQNLKAVALSAWIYVFPTNNEVKGNMVFTASSEMGVNVTWQGIGVVEPEVPRGKWFKVSKYFDLSSIQFKPDYKIQVYFWNNSRTDILVDDYTVVFGGPVDRRGDSAWVDMTKPAGFTSRFNYPPFPVSLLEKENTGTALKLAGINPGDMVIAGNFLNTGSDGLFIVRQDGRPSVYAYCTGDLEFRKIKLNNPSALAVIQPVKKILSGKFLGGQTEQIILAGDKGWLLCTIEQVKDICTASGSIETNLEILAKSEKPVPSLYAGDFNGDHRSEILEIADNGSWKVLAMVSKGMKGDSWKLIAEEINPVKHWNKSDKEIGISVGRFLPSSANDLVLTVSKSRAEGKYSYSLLKLNTLKMNWDAQFSEKQNNAGKIFGLDTLKPSDIFFTTHTGDEKEIRVFRYNRDWRYDLKEIRFNDTTFSILSNIDFDGYESGRNPKYYESLTLIPGSFLTSVSFSFLTVGSVEKGRHYESILPDFVHLYSFSAKK